MENVPHESKKLLIIGILNPSTYFSFQMEMLSREAQSSHSLDTHLTQVI